MNEIEKKEFIFKAKKACFDKSLDFTNDRDLQDIDVFLLLAKLSSNLFTIKDIDELSPRVFNHWKNNGILPVIKKDEGISKLTFIEYIWLRIVIVLRDFGFSLEKIKRVKKHLFIPGTEFNKSYSEDYYQKIYDETGQVDSKNMLGYSIVYLLDKKVNSKLIVDTDGTAYIEHEPLKSNLIFPYITIPLMSIIHSFITSTNNVELINRSGVLKESEIEVLKLLRLDKLKEISIMYDKGKPSFISVTNQKKVEIEHRLLDIFTKNNYQNIVIKQNKGNLYCEITTKRKLK